MPANASFDDLMGRLQAGDQDAATELFRRYVYRLVGLARDHLDSRVRRKVDPEDVVQSVFKSFFARQAAGDFELSSWDSLWSLLAQITLRKCGHCMEHLCAARRDVRKERGPPIGSEESSQSWLAIARGPTPSHAAMLAETLEQVMRGLDEREREIVQLKLEGYTPAEIAARVSRRVRTVQLLLQRVRKRLERMRDGDAVGV